MGRVLALGFGVWLRRFVPIHVVTAICLAPFVLVPEHGDPIEDGRIVGLVGLYSSAWLVVGDILVPVDEGLGRNVTIGYLAQFAITVIVIRDAHRRLSGRDGRRSLRAVPGLLAYALASLGVFVAIDLLVTWATLFTSPVSTFVGVLASSVAAAILAARLWIALPAAAVDGSTFFASLRRSVRLVRGTAAGIAFLAILLIVLQGVATMPFGFLASEMPWILTVPVVLFLTFKACVVAAAYRELCLLKEGPRPEELGAVFA